MKNQAPVLSNEEKVALNHFGATQSFLIVSENTVIPCAVKDYPIKISYNSLSTPVQKKKKFFITGKHKLTLSQIKNLVKSLDGKITNDVTRADYVLADDAKYEIDHSAYLFKSIHSSRFYSTLGTYETRNIIRKYLDQDEAPIDYDYTASKVYKISDLVTLYELSQNSLPVIDDTQLEEAADIKVPVTADLVDQLIRMFNSYSNDADVELANELVINIDFGADPYELWRLATGVSSWRYNKRSKRIRNFLDSTEYDMLSSLDPEDYFRQLERKNALYPKAVYLLEQKIRPKIYVRNNHMYKFTFEIKDEYKDYIRKYQKQLNDESNSVKKDP